MGGGGHYQHCGDDCPGNVAKGVKYIECLCCFSLFGIPKQFFVLHFFSKVRHIYEILAGSWWKLLEKWSGAVELDLELHESWRPVLLA